MSPSSAFFQGHLQTRDDLSSKAHKAKSVRLVSEGGEPQYGATNCTPGIHTLPGKNPEKGMMGLPRLEEKKHHVAIGKSRVPILTHTTNADTDDTLTILSANATPWREILRSHLKSP